MKRLAMVFGLAGQSRARLGHHRVSVHRGECIQVFGTPAPHQ